MKLTKRVCRRCVYVLRFHIELTERNGRVITSTLLSVAIEQQVIASFTSAKTGFARHLPIISARFSAKVQSLESNTYLRVLREFPVIGKYAQQTKWCKNALGEFYP